MPLVGITPYEPYYPERYVPLGLDDQASAADLPIRELVRREAYSKMAKSLIALIISLVNVRVLQMGLLHTKSNATLHIDRIQTSPRS